MYLTTSLSPYDPSDANTSRSTLFPEQRGGIPVLVLPSHNQMLEPASDIPDRSAISGNLAELYVESHSQWGNRTWPPESSISDPDRAAAAAVATPSVLRGDT